MSSLSQRAQIVASVLERKFPKVDGFLNYQSAFQLLIAVLLSAQCTDRQVNKVTPNLFAVAPNPESMVKLSVEELEKLIHSVGFYHTKARAILSLSRSLLERFHGEVPGNFKDLESLAGVGHKTASVMMAQYFKQPAFPVDTHIFRLAHRWKLSTGKTPEQVEQDLKRIFPVDEWYNLHLRMISYGRTECTARGCDGTRCEICKLLNFRKGRNETD